MTLYNRPRWVYTTILETIPVKEWQVRSSVLDRLPRSRTPPKSDRIRAVVPETFAFGDSCYEQPDIPHRERSWSPSGGRGGRRIGVGPSAIKRAFPFTNDGLGV